MKVSQFEPFIGDEEYKAIKDCFDNNWITEGPKSNEFSEKLIELTGAKYGVFAQNGTIALYLALKAIGIGPGHEVIVPNFTFIASANAVEMCGATPVFVDIDEKTLQINVNACQKSLTANTKAILPVHLYGMAADMTAVMRFAKNNNLMVVEDAAQGIGVKWKGRHVGTYGDVGCFSFFADKTITTGEGGFVITDDKEIYESMLYLRNQGRLYRGTFKHERIGYNFRITDIQAAIGIVQIGKLPVIIEKKKLLLEIYKENLRDIPGIRIVTPTQDSNHIPFRVVIVSDFPINALIKFLKEKEIETRTAFYPLHRQPCYSSYASSTGDFCVSDYIYDHAACLPTYPSLAQEKVVYICDSIREYVRGNTV